MRTVFRFPDPVNEVAARLVATGVVIMSLAYLATGWVWVLAVLAYGFVARAATGPTLSPLGQLVTRFIAPNLPLSERPVPGPPKRFAQGIGAVLSSVALAAHLLGSSGTALVLVAMITVAASLEAAVAFCLGCKIFAGLIRLGIVPQTVCEACSDLSKRPVLT